MQWGNVGTYTLIQVQYIPVGFAKNRCVGTKTDAQSRVLPAVCWLSHHHWWPPTGHLCLSLPLASPPPETQKHSWLVNWWNRHVKKTMTCKPARGEDANRKLKWKTKEYLCWNDVHKTCFYILFLFLDTPHQNQSQLHTFSHFQFLHFSAIPSLYSKHRFHVSALQALNSLDIYLPIRSRHRMEMSLCYAVLPGLGRLVAQWFEAVFCSAPLQRSWVPLVHFISPQGLCKRGMQGGSTLPSQLPHDVYSKLSLLGIKSRETMYKCRSFILYQQLNCSLTTYCMIAAKWTLLLQSHPSITWKYVHIGGFMPSVNVHCQCRK